MTDRELMQQAFNAMEQHFLHHENGCAYLSEIYEALRARLSQCDRCGEYNPAEIHTCTPKQEPVAFFTEENGFPETFVPKDSKTEAIRSLTDQCAELVWERDELKKQVQRYERHGVTCQTYQHKIEKSCGECNVQEHYRAPPQREWVGLTEGELMDIVGVTSADSDWNVAIVHKWVCAVEKKLKNKNHG